MGTRNLTCVVLDGKLKVAQYGQWDGYPSGQGKTICKFIRKTLCTVPGQKKFKKAVSACRFVTQADVEKKYKKLGIETKDGMIGWGEAEKFKKKYPALDRDAGGTVLELVLNGAKELTDHSQFAADSLFCEWAYVVDLDKKVLEVYKGFNTKYAKPKGRFSDMVNEREMEMRAKHPEMRKENKYYPVRLVETLPFGDIKEDSMEKLQEKLSKEDDDE